MRSSGGWLPTMTTGLPAHPGQELYAVVVVDRFDAPTKRALDLAEDLQPHRVVAVNACVDAELTKSLIREWARRRIDVSLTSVVPLGEADDPVRRFVEGLTARHPSVLVLVVIPIVVPRRRWQRLLHRTPDPGLPSRLADLDRVAIAQVSWRLRGAD